MNRNKKIGILLAAVIAAGIPIAGSVYSEQVKLVSKGAISYDEDGDGVEETLIDSEDLKRLMGAISEAASSQSAYAGKLEELQKNLEQNRLDTDKANDALIKDKTGLVEALHSKFPGVELIDKLTEKASFEDIIAAVDSLASPSSAKINYGDFRAKKATSSLVGGTQGINIAGATEINLDKNQQLVLPGGYYGSDVTINNIISGKTLNWNPSEKTTFVITEPITSGTISTENSYNAGYDTGKSDGYKSGYDQGVKDGKKVGNCTPYHFSEWMNGHHEQKSATINVTEKTTIVCYRARFERTNDHEGEKSRPHVWDVIPPGMDKYNGSGNYVVVSTKGIKGSIQLFCEGESFCKGHFEVDAFAVENR